MLEFSDVRSEASGKWLSIFRQLGIDVREDGKHGKCPSCAGTDRFRVDRNVAERGSYYCSGCGPGDGFSLVMKVLGVDIGEAMKSVAEIVGSCTKSEVPRENKMTPERMRGIFNTSKAISFLDDPGGKYLANRGLSTVPNDLYFTNKCWEPDTKQNEKAMLAIVRLIDGTATTMHRTFLSPESEKLPIDNPKKMLPTLHGTNGAAIHLFEAGETLGVCEGIETAIAAHQDVNIPVWACISNVIMESFIPPPIVKSLVIFADNDRNFAGQKSAYNLANKIAIKYKLNVQVMVPERTGDDWLDQYIRSKR